MFTDRASFMDMKQNCLRQAYWEWLGRCLSIDGTECSGDGGPMAEVVPIGKHPGAWTGS